MKLPDDMAEHMVRRVFLGLMNYVCGMLNWHFSVGRCRSLPNKELPISCRKMLKSSVFGAFRIVVSIAINEFIKS